MKYLPKETCECLVSLGCVSESGMLRTLESDVFGEKYWTNCSVHAIKGRREHSRVFQEVPAFSLEDILRKDNAEKIKPGYSHCGGCQKGSCKHANKLGGACCHYFPRCFDWKELTDAVVYTFQENPDAWPELVARLIKPNS